jgi:DNA replication protein DnaC
LIRELATMAFVYRAENVIFLGPPGVGKTHLAVGLAIEALSQGMSVYFTSLSRLIEDLKKAHKENPYNQHKGQQLSLKGQAKDRVIR